MKERVVSFITEAFNMPVCRMAAIEDPDHNHITIHKRHTCGCCRFVNRDRSCLPLLLLTIAGRGGREPAPLTGC